MDTDPLIGQDTPAGRVDRVLYLGGPKIGEIVKVYWVLGPRFPSLIPADALKARIEHHRATEQLNDTSWIEKR